jgi:hypothetical protein
MDLMTAIAAVTQGLQAVKTLRDIEKEVDSATYKLEVANLADALATAKIGLLDAQQEILGKDREIERLKKAVEFQGELVEHRGHHYERGADGLPLGAPFCPVCIADDLKHIRLTRGEGMHGNADCPRCESHFKHVDFRPPKDALREQ